MIEGLTKIYSAKAVLQVWSLANWMWNLWQSLNWVLYALRVELQTIKTSSLIKGSCGSLATGYS